MTLWHKSQPVAVQAAPAPVVSPDATSQLRHDLRGILSPALLVADGLTSHEDPKVRRAGEVIVRTVERAAARLSA